MTGRHAGSSEGASCIELLTNSGFVSQQFRRSLLVSVAVVVWCVSCNTGTPIAEYERQQAALAREKEALRVQRQAIKSSQSVSADLDARIEPEAVQTKPAAEPPR